MTSLRQHRAKHDLKHTGIALLTAARIEPMEIARRASHPSVAVTCSRRRTSWNYCVRQFASRKGLGRKGIRQNPNCRHLSWLLECLFLRRLIRYIGTPMTIRARIIGSAPPDPRDDPAGGYVVVVVAAARTIAMFPITWSFLPWLACGFDVARCGW